MKYNFLIKLLAALVIVLVIVIPLFKIDGGLVDDDYFYFKIAEDLPNFNISIFPLGYPVLLKLTNLFFHDYFISSRFLSITSIIFILIFSFYKKFFFRETVLLLCLKTFTIFMFSLSETIFLPILYVTLYSLYQIIVNEKNKYLLLTISLFLLVTVRYSGLFVFLGILLFVLIEYFGYEKKYRKTLTKSLAIAFILITGFLLMNYYFTTAFFGENLRGASISSNASFFSFLLKGIIFPIFISFNPIVEIMRYNLLSFIFSLFLGSAFFIPTVYVFIKNFKKVNKDFFRLVIALCLVYFIGLIYSSYKTGIEALHFRLMLPIFISFYFLLLISIKDNKKNVFFIIVAFISLIVNVSFNFIDSFNYLEKRKNVITYYNQHRKEYYFNDVNAVPTETGGVITSNFFTIYCVNPQIIKLNKKTNNIKKEKIIFESQLIKINPVNRFIYINNYSITK